jgi:hypothetical protein
MTRCVGSVRVVRGDWGLVETPLAVGYRPIDVWRAATLGVGTTNESGPKAVKPSTRV